MGRHMEMGKEVEENKSWAFPFPFSFPFPFPGSIFSGSNLRVHAPFPSSLVPLNPF